MSRRLPSTKIDIVGNLDLRPEDAVKHFMASKAQRKYFLNTKPPNWDSAGDSIDMLYIHNTREHASLLDTQKEMLTNANHQAKINKQRISNMYKAQDWLRKRFIEVNSFIKECVDKKLQAERAVEAETELHTELRKGISYFTTSIKELEVFRDSIKTIVEDFLPYEQVLNDVVQKSQIFASPKDCMGRCDALMLAQVEISKLEQIKIKEIEEMRQQMVKVTNEAALTVLGLKNDLAELERSYNQARQSVIKWEHILSTTKNALMTNQLENQRTNNAVQVLYYMLCRRRGVVASLKPNQTEEIMDYIKREIEILQAVVKELNVEKSEQENNAKTIITDDGKC